MNAGSRKRRLKSPHKVQGSFFATVKKEPLKAVSEISGRVNRWMSAS